MLYAFVGTRSIHRQSRLYPRQQNNYNHVHSIFSLSIVRMRVGYNVYVCMKCPLSTYIPPSEKLDPKLKVVNVRVVVRYARDIYVEVC